MRKVIPKSIRDCSKRKIYSISTNNLVSSKTQIIKMLKNEEIEKTEEGHGKEWRERNKKGEESPEA